MKNELLHVTFSIAVDCGNHPKQLFFYKPDGLVQQIPGLMLGVWVKLGLCLAKAFLELRDLWKHP